ncbi:MULTISPECIES: hypothetical protein [Streptomyces]|uniref:Restriction endonuclease type IV Mrr domain-containing protein n=1 Tax=Streptomyces lichenis TaxID=2306967 RepID=A0ABT0IBI0_9ACTN|nr:hypothetical protein [Streptomyces lichenis]MCK8678676.1 hypothetical protein [Streptomyces lichenis]
MTENVPVRCPACRRTHGYTPPSYPCPCGTPVVPPVLRGAPAEPITHRTWTDAWITARCAACGRQDQWPQPELGCPCGTVLRLPVRPVASPAPQRETQGGGSGPTSSATGLSTAPAHIPLPRTAAPPRPAFRPVTIRTARDAVSTAARYLRWLGFRDVVQPEERPAGPVTGVDLRGHGLVARVDPTTRPTSLRAVECLWLTGLATEARGVAFSLAGYAPEARARAEGIGLPLFVMDLTGIPQPLGGAADELLAGGA